MGGWNSVEATILLMKKAINEKECNRFVLLQGLDYPIKSNKDIEVFFNRNQTIEFIKAQNISESNKNGESYKFRFFYFFDQKSNPLAKIPCKIIHFLNSQLAKGSISFKKNYVVDCNGKKMQIFQGCAQFGLTLSAVKYILNFYNNNSSFNRYFKTMFAPDEAYFHTIIYNSPFVLNTVDGKAVDGSGHLEDFMNLTYFEYPVCIRVFTNISEWGILDKSGFLFFRKASSDSRELLDYIDRIHGSYIVP